MLQLPFSDAGNQRRIVVTGIGVVSACGRTPATFWKSLTHPLTQSSLAAEEQSIPSGAADFSGRIDDFCELPTAIRKSIQKALKLMNRETQMGVAAGQQALLDSGLLQDFDPERIGVCFGAENASVKPEDFLSGVQACSDSNGSFDVERWGEEGIPEVAPLWLLKCLPNMPACHLAILNDLRGPNNTITQRDVAANMAIAEACRAIKDDDADAMLVGATGTTLSAFNLMHARLEDEVFDGTGDAVCRPFDKRRNGSGPGEGAGVVVLEDARAALRRGAHIYGEILGTASTARIGHDGAAACGQALSSAMQQLMTRAGLRPDSLGHIHAHGLGTLKSDIAEARAICQVLGEAVRTVPVVAVRSQLSNAGAGMGALQLIASLLALRNGHLFPVLNFSEPDPECPVEPVTSCDAVAGNSFLNLSMFGRGLASCVAVGTFRE